MSQFIIVDNGSYNIKSGYSTFEEPMIQSNSITKTKDGSIYISNDYRNTNNHSGIIFKRPHDQGNLVSWETEKLVWDYAFNEISTQYITLSKTSKSKSKTMDFSSDSEIDFKSLGLILTETPFQLPQLSINTDQIVFEEFEFQNYYRCIPQSLVPWTLDTDIENDFNLIIDCGFNATWIIPVIYKSVYWKGVKKLPIGGKLLNGLLREFISFRHYDINEDPILINTIKESTCFMAANFNEALKTKEANYCQFILPDFKTTTTGYVKKNDGKPLQDNGDLQSLNLVDERFVIPESLYHPEIIFDNSPNNNSIIHSTSFKNLSDLVIESIMSSPEIARPLLSQNISIVGGTSLLPNFSERLKTEISKELPQDWKIKILHNDYRNDLTNWYGGLILSQSDIIDNITISKQDYYEHGSNWCQKQFGFKNI